MRIVKGVYGLPQAGMLANNFLKERIRKHGYVELPHTPGLFMHKTQLIWFTLVVDNFGIKCIDKGHAYHLIRMLKRKYIAVATN